MLKRHISMCVIVLEEWEVRYLTPALLANPAVSLSGESSVTWVEITLGNMILCTSLKRHPYQTTFILIRYRVKKKKTHEEENEKDGITEKRYYLIYLRGSSFLSTIQTTFILTQRNSVSAVPLLQHKAPPLPHAFPSPPDLPSSSSFVHIVQCDS